MRTYINLVAPSTPTHRHPDEKAREAGFASPQPQVPNPALLEAWSLDPKQHRQQHLGTW